MNVISPVTAGMTRKVAEYSFEEISSRYQEKFNINIDRFKPIGGNLILYRCLDTGYEFFEPQDVSGDNVFYQELQKFDWYYMEKKWEHIEALKLINNGSFLEIGCAKGAFLEQLRDYKKDIKIYGQELNTSAVNECRARGFSVNSLSFSELTEEYANKIDSIASFQVLEHVSAVSSFFKTSYALLKKDGRLVISVPNMGSFIKHNDGGVLNFPPHHVGWWDRESLKKTGKIFGFEFELVRYEPLQEYHYKWYLDNLLSRLVRNDRLRCKLFSKKIKRRLIPAVRFIAKWVKGHTILVCFRKK